MTFLSIFHNEDHHSGDEDDDSCHNQDQHDGDDGDEDDEGKEGGDYVDLIMIWMIRK